MYTDSRYASGNLYRAFLPETDARPETFSATVLRNFPDSISKFYLYTWQEQDRIDLVARRFLGNVIHWWYLMDYNPEVLNPFDIPAGTVLRVPDAR